MEELANVIKSMEPPEAMAEIAKILKDLFATVDEEARVGFVLSLLEKAEADKVSSLVHL